MFQNVHLFLKSGSTCFEPAGKEVGELRKLTYGLLLVLQGDEAAARDVTENSRVEAVLIGVSRQLERFGDALRCF